MVIADAFFDFSAAQTIIPQSLQTILQTIFVKLVEFRGLCDQLQEIREKFQN